MILRSTLYYVNMISWICIVLAHSKQQSVGRHVVSLRQIIPIQRQPVCSYSFMLDALRRSSSYVFIVFGVTRLGLEPMIYSTRSEHAKQYINDAVETK